jgi:hypothetical protein
MEAPWARQGAGERSKDATDSGSNWANYTTANTGGGLASNNVTGVSADANGNVYAATNAGLSTASEVPDPLPLLGAALPLSFCRRLRSRSQRLRHAASSRLA